MSTKNNKRKLDAYRPTFDPHLDIATVVFSHVQCVKTRDSLAQVSKLWRDASKPAAAYPSRFDFDAFPHEEEEEEASDSEEEEGMDDCTRKTRVLDLMDNDEALSLPYERVVGLLGEIAEPLYIYAAFRGSVRLLKWARENNLDWTRDTCASQPQWTLARSQVLARERVPLGTRTRAVRRPIQKLGLPAVRGG